MILEVIEANVMGVNTYIVGDEETKEVALIDPTGNFDKIKGFVEKMELRPICIILTHGHGDHIGAVIPAREHYGCPVIAHEDEKEMLGNAQLNLSPFLGMGPIEFEADRYVQQGDEIEIGSLRLKVLHTPGHSKGGICLYAEDVMFTGDTLFAGSMGRTDLRGGDEREMMDSLRTLKHIKQEYRVFPGHGPASLLSKEKVHNPFMRNLT